MKTTLNNNLSRGAYETAGVSSQDTLLRPRTSCAPSPTSHSINLQTRPQLRLHFIRTRQLPSYHIGPLFVCDNKELTNMEAFLCENLPKAVIRGFIGLVITAIERDVGRRQDATIQ